ncbi:hypothetical protein ACIRD6_32265 [Streptomyces sp. NPDC102473]
MSTKRGMAGWLVRAHGGNGGTWGRAVTSTRALYAAETAEDEPGHLSQA